MSIKLKIPLLSSPVRTLARWTSELRAISFLSESDFFWTNYSPTILGSGSLTITSQLVYWAKYIKIGSICFISINCDVTASGSGDIIIFTVPFNSAESTGVQRNAGTNIAGLRVISYDLQPESNEVQAYRISGTVYTTGTVGLRLNFFYICNG